MKAMARQRSHSIEFKRQVAQEFIAGESLYALSKRKPTYAVQQKARLLDHPRRRVHRDLVLHREDVVERAIIAFSPEMCDRFQLRSIAR
jgi:hypothetical protein